MSDGRACLWLWNSFSPSSPAMPKRKWKPDGRGCAGQIEVGVFGTNDGEEVGDGGDGKAGRGLT